MVGWNGWFIVGCSGVYYNFGFILLTHEFLLFVIHGVCICCFVLLFCCS